jgi:hypothetical protein
MDELYIQIRERARLIVSAFPVQPFYEDFAEAFEISRNLFETDPVIQKLREHVDKHIENNNLGHGLDHAVKVTLDAGTLMLVEGEIAGYEEENRKRSVFLTQCAGLLHDIKRSHKGHAEKGADYARKMLGSWKSFTPGEVSCIAEAIHNHEAFKQQQSCNTPEGTLISDCLYDADKFRWGPDNFTHTVWDMLEFADVPLSVFVSHFPKGIAALERIKTSFRTTTGMKYGPQFIDTGLAIGEKLFSVIQDEFSEYL